MLFSVAVKAFPAVAVLLVSASLGQSQHYTETEHSRGANVSGTPAFFFVAPNGKPTASGGIEDPWDLETALSHPAAVRPGDTIWLRGGQYGTDTKQLTSHLAGTAQQPVILRQYPRERATIHGGLAIYGPYTWYWGFEVMNSEPNRHTGAVRPECIDTYRGSEGIKLINLALHDCLQGIGLWVDAIDAEVSGNLIYYNGEAGPTRGVGHAIYTQNQTGTKHLSDNIMFDQFDIGLQAYGSSKAFVKGYDLEGNVSFNNGSLYGSHVDDILFAVGSGLDNIFLTSNFTYQTPDADQGQSRMGWQFGGDNASVTVKDNYWVGGKTSIEMRNWTHATFSNNVTYSAKSLNLLLETGTRSTSAYAWDDNTYYGSGLFNLNGAGVAFSDWKSATHLDSHSQFHPGRPTGIWTFVRPNKYEPGRANIIIYNWDLKPAVSVDLSSILKTGDSFVIRDAENYFGAPLVTGIWRNTAVAIPMTGLKKAIPVGTVPAPPIHTAPEFGVFIVSRQ